MATKSGGRDVISDVDLSQIPAVSTSRDIRIDHDAVMHDTTIEYGSGADTGSFHIRHGPLPLSGPLHRIIVS